MFLVLNSLLLLPWLYHRKDPWDNIYVVSGELLIGLIALCWFSKEVGLEVLSAFFVPSSQEVWDVTYEPRSVAL